MKINYIFQTGKQGLQYYDKYYPNTVATSDSAQLVFKL